MAYTKSFYNGQALLVDDKGHQVQLENIDYDSWVNKVNSGGYDDTANWLVSQGMLDDSNQSTMGGTDYSGSYASSGFKGTESDYQAALQKGVAQSASGYSSSGHSSSGSGNYQPSADVLGYDSAGRAKALTPDYTLNYLQGPAGQAYEAAMNVIANDIGQKPTYDGKYDTMLEDSYNNIVNREPFKWDANTDDFYKAYEQRYTDLGQKAMKDTMGQAANLTGGYGNSYAQYVGNAAYNDWMDALMEKSVQLEQRAYDRYMDAGNQLVQQFGLLSNLRDNDYGRYRDDVSDYNYNLALLQAYEAENYARAQYNNNLRIQAEQTGYDRARDELSDIRYNDQLGYDRWRDQVSDERYNTEWDYQVQKDAQEFAYQQARDAAADAQWQQEMDLKRYSLNNSGSSSSGSSGRSSGGSSSGGSSSATSGSSAPSWWNSMSTEERKALQREIGTDADGIWGPKTSAAYNAMYGGYSYNGISGAEYAPSGDNGYSYSLNGYTGEKIYTTLLEEAAQAKYQQDLIDQYVKKK